MDTHKIHLSNVSYNYLSLNIDTYIWGAPDTTYCNYRQAYYIDLTIIIIGMFVPVLTQLVLPAVWHANWMSVEQT